ncbi:MAG: hypothetical protein LBI82_02645 [Dysgonamonadaceae bacterium]|jgi:predicted O-methyltransferase YrrM|nr:hypothetical protein [Dysgonamonadaceae bacterium]
MKIIPEKLYRRIRYRKGHGVHSPFAFNFITNVIEEKLPYYVFEDIEKQRAQLLSNKEIIEFISAKGNAKRKTVAAVTSQETQSDKYGALLFRLVNFLQCKSALQIGASTGVMTLYLASSRKDMQCVVLEDREELVSIVRKLCSSLQLNNVSVKKGEYLSSLDEVLKEHDYFDMVFVNTIRNPELTRHILERQIKTKLLIVDNIRKDKKSKALWQMIKDNPHARITIDLYHLGIALFEEKFYKKHYKAHFDNGKRQLKKQDLYKVGRQRLNFFNWRKKNNKKQHSLRNIRNH